MEDVNVSDRQLARLQSASTSIGFIGAALIGIGIGAPSVVQPVPVCRDLPVVIDHNLAESSGSPWLLDVAPSAIVRCLADIHDTLVKQSVDLDDDAKRAIYSDLWELYG